MTMFMCVNIRAKRWQTLRASWGFPGGSIGKGFTSNAGDEGLIPGPRRSLREGNGHLLQYFCLGNPTDRGTWWATVHGVTKESGHDLATKPPLKRFYNRDTETCFSFVT